MSKLKLTSFNVKEPYRPPFFTLKVSDLDYLEELTPSYPTLPPGSGTPVLPGLPYLPDLPEENDKNFIIKPSGGEEPGGEEPGGEEPGGEEPGGEEPGGEEPGGEEPGGEEPGGEEPGGEEPGGEEPGGEEYNWVNIGNGVKILFGLCAWGIPSRPAQNNRDLRYKFKDETKIKLNVTQDLTNKDKFYYEVPIPDFVLLFSWEDDTERYFKIEYPGEFIAYSAALGADGLIVRAESKCVIDPTNEELKSLFNVGTDVKRTIAITITETTASGEEISSSFRFSYDFYFERVSAYKDITVTDKDDGVWAGIAEYI